MNLLFQPSQEWICEDELLTDILDRLFGLNAN